MSVFVFVLSVLSYPLLIYVMFAVLPIQSLQGIFIIDLGDFGS